MDFTRIKYGKAEHIGWIRVAEVPGGQEGFEGLVYEISDACAAIASDNDVWVVVFTGVEKISLLPATDAGKNPTSLSLTRPLAGIVKPLIAGISGDVIGLGLEVILACDIRIAAEQSRFGSNHLERGSIPHEGGTQRLSRLVGKGKALEMLLTGNIIDSKEAYRIGLINKIVDGQDLDDVIRDTALEMASKSPIALNYAKETINAGMDMTLDQGLRLEADLYMLMHTSSDRTEGIRAFQEKRTPQFKGQ